MKDKFYSVYLITNKINHKQYIGITSRSVEARFKEHIRNSFSGKQRIINLAIKKYGVENFELIILEENIKQEDASEKEILYIKQYNTYYKNGGYNMTIGGNGAVGYEFTEEDKQKISLVNLGRVFSLERNNKIRLAMVNRFYKQEWRDNLSRARVGRFRGKENPFYGKHHSEQTKQKARVSRKTKYVCRLDIKTNDLLETYESGIFAAHWVIQNNISKAHPNTIRGQIAKACNNSYYIKTCYGYKWKFKERLID